MNYHSQKVPSLFDVTHNPSNQPSYPLSSYLRPQSSAVYSNKIGMSCHPLIPLSVYLFREPLSTASALFWCIAIRYSAFDPLRHPQAPPARDIPGNPGHPCAKVVHEQLGSPVNALDRWRTSFIYGCKQQHATQHYIYS